MQFEVVNLDGSYRQYIGGRDRKGTIWIYVNGFCRTLERDMNTEWIQVHDGGWCYWQALVNLTSGKIEWLYVNGV